MRVDEIDAIENPHPPNAKITAITAGTGMSATAPIVNAVADHPVMKPRLSPLNEDRRRATRLPTTWPTAQAAMAMTYAALPAPRATNSGYSAMLIIPVP